jgi:hypothetical protein
MPFQTKVDQYSNFVVKDLFTEFTDPELTYSTIFQSGSILSPLYVLQ